MKVPGAMDVSCGAQRSICDTHTTSAATGCFAALRMTCRRWFLMSCYARAYTAAIEQVGRGLVHRHAQPGLFAAVGKPGGIIVILHDLEGTAIIQGAHL